MESTEISRRIDNALSWRLAGWMNQISEWRVLTVTWHQQTFWLVSCALVESKILGEKKWLWRVKITSVYVAGVRARIDWIQGQKKSTILHDLFPAKHPSVSILPRVFLLASTHCNKKRGRNAGNVAERSRRIHRALLKGRSAPSLLLNSHQAGGETRSLHF